MTYKCLKCGGEDVERFTPQIFSAEVTIPVQKDVDEGDIAFESTVKDAKIYLSCKTCSNMSLSSDETRFAIVE